MLIGMAFILLLGLLGSILGWYLCFWIIDVFFHTYWVSWLVGTLAFAIIMSGTLFIVFGEATDSEKREPSKTSLWPLVIGFLIGSWWNKD